MDGKLKVQTKAKVKVKLKKRKKKALFEHQKLIKLNYVNNVFTLLFERECLSRP